MRKLILLSVAFFFLAIPLSGQSTLVTGTFRDMRGQAFINGSYIIQFVPSSSNPTATPMWMGMPLPPGQQHYESELDGSGSLSVSLPSNSAIAPAGSQWRFTICPQATSACTVRLLTITGSAMNLSTLIVGPPIDVDAAQYRPSAYSDIEVRASIGQMYYNLLLHSLRICSGSTAGNCTLWQAVGGGGGPGGGNGAPANITSITAVPVPPTNGGSILGPPHATLSGPNAGPPANNNYSIQFGIPTGLTGATGPIGPMGPMGPKGDPGEPGTSGGGITFQQNGSGGGVATTVNCTTNLTCTHSGSTVTMSASGGGPGGGLTMPSGLRTGQALVRSASDTLQGAPIDLVNTAQATPGTMGAVQFRGNLAIEEFEMTGRKGNNIGLPVPYFEPLQNNRAIAFDLVPKGTPTNGLWGVSWVHICDTDINTIAAGPNGYSCLMLAVPNGSGNMMFGTDRYAPRPIRGLCIQCGQAGGGGLVIGNNLDPAPTTPGVTINYPLVNNPGLAIRAGADDRLSLAVSSAAGSYFSNAATGDVAMRGRGTSLRFGSIANPTTPASTMVITAGNPGTVETAGGVISIGTPLIQGTGACANLADVHGGAWAGDAVCLGPTDASTITITLPPDTHEVGMSCFGSDQSAMSPASESAETDKTCTIAFDAVATGDKINWAAFGYGGFELPNPPPTPEPAAAPVERAPDLQ